MTETVASILIVDDEPDMCWILENIISKSGFTFKTALNASKALALTECNNFCMAFLDAKLPDIDGLELARQLRKTDANLLIVIVSGGFYQDDQTIEEALHSGLITAFIAKPFDHYEIASVIARYESSRECLPFISGMDSIGTIP